MLKNVFKNCIIALEMTEILDRQFRTAVDQVVPMVPDLASRRLNGRWASVLEKKPLAVRSELEKSLVKQGVDTTTEEAQGALPKMECYTLLGAVGTHLYPTIIDGEGQEARFKSELTDDMKLARDFKNTIKPIFQNGFSALAATQDWVQTVRGRYPQASDEYLNPPHKREMAVHQPKRLMAQDIDGGDLGTTTQELIRLARKLEVQSGNVLPVGASPELQAEVLAARRKTVETHLIGLGLARGTINIGYHANAASTLRPLSQLEGSIETFTTQRGHERTAFRRESAANLREVFPRDDKFNEGPTLKCPFHHGKSESSEANPLSGYLYAAIDLAYEKGYFMRDNDIRAMRGDPELDITTHFYA
jgi:hypothetical protein